jgi:hypothetical protein
MMDRSISFSPFPTCAFSLIVFSCGNMHQVLEHTLKTTKNSSNNNNNNNNNNLFLYLHVREFRIRGGSGHFKDAISVLFTPHKTEEETMSLGPRHVAWVESLSKSPKLHLKLFWNILKSRNILLESFRIILDHFGIFWNILEYFGLFAFHSTH